MRALLDCNYIHSIMWYRMVDIYFDDDKREEVDELKSKLSLLHFITKRMIRLWQYDRDKTDEVRRAIEAGEWFVSDFYKCYYQLKQEINNLLFN